jgi:peptidoglycan/LPS O-acetylase OafA/YrhL
MTDSAMGLAPEAPRFHHVHSLDILRSIAIIMVMCWHLPHAAKLALAPVSQIGLWGVDLFFVLSGFLISNQLFTHLIREKKIKFLSFYLKRVFRTWPSYFVVLALYLWVPEFGGQSGMPPLWKFLTFTQNFELTFSPFSHAWSLCIEEQFYLVFPIVAHLLARYSNRKFAVVFVVVLLLIGIVTRGAMWFAFVNKAGSALDYQYYSKIYYPTWSRLDGLILGVSIAAIKNMIPQMWDRLIRFGNLFLGLGFFVLIFGFWLQSDRYSLAAVLFGFPAISFGFAAIVISAISPGSMFSRLRIPGAGFIASLSYSLYLLHKEVFRIFAAQFESFGFGNIYLTIFWMFLASLICAMVLHLLIERPFLVFREKLLRS